MNSSSLKRSSAGSGSVLAMAKFGKSQTHTLSMAVFFLHRGKAMSALAQKEKTLLIFVSSSEVCCNENNGRSFQRIKAISSMMKNYLCCTNKSLIRE